MNTANQDNLISLNEIRDCILLIEVGNIYLCEDIFLKKFGATIDSNLHNIEEGITSLKDQFPGKFADEVDTNKIVEKLRKNALQLQKPVENFSEKCARGEFGKELESNFKALTSAINKIKSQTGTKIQEYKKGDSVRSSIEQLKDTGSYFLSYLQSFFKVFALIVIALVVAFCVLYFTMESESDLSGKIAAAEAQIRSYKQITSDKELEKLNISDQIKAKEKRDMTRLEKLEIMDLEALIHQVDQDIKEIEVEIKLQEDEITSNKEEIEKIKKIPLIKRLLRI